MFFSRFNPDDDAHDGQDRHDHKNFSAGDARRSGFHVPCAGRPFVELN